MSTVPPNQDLKPTSTGVDPEHPAKPDSPTQISATSWKFILQSTLRQFSNNGCSDTAAGLTYRTLFSIFPALIALVSILSLVGQSGDTVKQVLAEAENVIPVDAWDSVAPILEGLLTAPAPGLGLVIGLATALWSSSGYVKAFGKAMNTIYGVPEGRGFVKLSAQMYGLTALILVLAALAAIMVAVSGPVAETIGALIGLGDQALMVWGIAKWFVVGLIVIVVVGLLYHLTPNVKQPRFRWISVGACVAIVVSLVATIGFFFYVANFGNYNATYGALAGVIIFLLWIYIINTILLFGGQLDAEIERGRELQGGIAAEKELQLPQRDSTASDKAAEKARTAIEQGRALRLSKGETTDVDTLPASEREDRMPGDVTE